MESKNALENVLSISTKQECATINSEIEYHIHFENVLKFEIYNLIIPIMIPFFTIFKEDSLYINGECYKLNEKKLFKISNFPSGSILDISYKVIIQDIPKEGAINNYIILSYLENNFDGVINEVKSNAVLTRVKGVKLNIEKSLNKEDIHIGDEIFEDITIINTGNIKALNLILEEIMPSNILMKSILLNGSELINSKENIKIPIGNLDALSSIKVRCYGKVVGINDKVESLITKLSYNYFDDYTNKYATKKTLECNIPINVREGHIGGKIGEANSLTIDKESVLIGEEVKISFKAYNIGNIDIENVVIKLSTGDCKTNVLNLKKIEPGEEIKFEGTIKVDGLQKEEGTVKSEEENGLTYNKDEEKDYTESKGEKIVSVIAEYEYFDYSKDEIIRKVYNSNSVKFKTYGVVLTSNKECNAYFAMVGDIVDYKICLKNDGNIKCSNLNFKEERNEISEFLKGSFKVNGKEVECEDIYEWVNIGELDVLNVLYIEYKVKIKDIVKGDFLISTSHLQYIEKNSENLDLIKVIESSFNNTRIVYPMLLEKEYENNIEDYKKQEMIPYNIKITNEGNTTLNNIRIDILKPSQFEFKKVCINGNEAKLDVIGKDGIEVELLKKKESINVEALLEVNGDIKEKIVEIKGTVKYCYKVGEDEENNTAILNLTPKMYNIIYGDFNVSGILKEKNSIIGDGLDGEIVFENTGNVDLYDIELICNENNTLELLDLTSIDKEKIQKLIKPQEIFIIPIKLKEKENCKGKIFNFNLTVNAKYRFNKEEVKINKNLEELKVELVDEGISCDIKSDKKTYIIGDRACFDMDITNLGSHSLNEAFLKIDIPKEIELVQDSIYIRGRKYKYLDIINGIDLEKIEVNERVAIKCVGIIKDSGENKVSKEEYDFINPNKMKEEISTFYKIKGSYTLESNGQKIYKEYLSKVLKNRVEKASAKIFLSGDKELLLKGQEITYTSTIINDGTLPINIKYKLLVGNELEKIPSLTEVNGERIESIETPIKIEVNDGVTIEETYLYRKFNGIDKLLVQGVLEAYYKTLDEEYNGYKKIKSEELVTEVTNTTFKEVIVEKFIDTSNIYPSVREVLNVYVNPMIFDKSIRKVQRNYEFNGKEVIGYRLDIMGKMLYTVEYICYQGDEGVYLISDKEFFTTSIVLPEDFINGEYIEIKPKILDVDFKIIQEDRIFVNVNLLINTNI